MTTGGETPRLLSSETGEFALISTSRFATTTIFIVRSAGVDTRSRRTGDDDRSVRGLYDLVYVSSATATRLQFHR
ncbi:hypothetical protein EA462_16545 [Natrarchaeobius halalkaliphilus]|uniref:Uncharacterized protein n=1 Tax=Natrarchaeobius halalkaliphilus TaxID=1679091 RepID=A0A3N6MR72_9EURY|nr:hypothetical protein EA462_16545 [Natrarchaeobius halalkaliphilus]